MKQTHPPLQELARRHDGAIVGPNRPCLPRQEVEHADELLGLRRREAGAAKQTEGIFSSGCPRDDGGEAEENQEVGGRHWSGGRAMRRREADAIGPVATAGIRVLAALQQGAERAGHGGAGSTDHGHSRSRASAAPQQGGARVGHGGGSSTDLRAPRSHPRYDVVEVGRGRHVGGWESMEESERRPLLDPPALA
jgi:hypothetical protein